MANTLEELQPGTPVFVGDTHVADVRAVYGPRGAHSAELLVVHWLDRHEDVALPVLQVELVDEVGVHLMNSDVHSYAALPPFEAARYPTVVPLS